MPNPKESIILQELLGCAWGREVSTPDDQELCPNQAVQIVVLHKGYYECYLKLCAVHRDRILSETTPHEN